MIFRHIDYGRPLKLSGWRRTAIGTWRAAGDPSVYAVIELEVEAALSYIEREKARSGQKITFTHFIGKAMAETIRRHPEINCVLRWGNLYPRKSIDIFFQVASDDHGEDLAGAVIRGADKKSLVELALELGAKSARIRERGDEEFKKMKDSIAWLPGIFSRAFVSLGGLFLYGLNLWSPLLGAPRDAFGSVMITSIGSLGIDLAFPPLIPYCRVPTLIAVGAIREQPVARDGKLGVAKISKLAVTFDHRLIDGVHGARMSQTLKKIVAHPERELGGGEAS